MRDLDSLKKMVELWEGMLAETNDLFDMLEIAKDDEILQKELEQRFEILNKKFEQHQFEIMMAGEYDLNNAIMMIHSGTGGTEAQDWAEMLLRMYLRYCEKRGWQTEIIDKVLGSEAGIKNATIKITGNYAYGYLKAEAGIHRLVRQSPFDADHARHTSFALVEVIPELSSDINIQIDPSELRIDTYRSSGAGGQSVNKTSSAVRITHLPTGIVVACQNERSQAQNRETAMSILKSRLFERELKRKNEEKAKIRGEHIEATWSNQIRSYVLHPYKMVKDHRTEYEVKDAEAVLNGDLDGFIDEYLKRES
jgi:peptide chain release factor 2